MKPQPSQTANPSALRGVVYARYSTEEQNPKSIDDQDRFCRKQLAVYGLDGAQVELLCDQELSGELRSRPGINQLKAGIDARRWDFIIAEDSSRLFRDPAACHELVGAADDEGIRVILPGDQIDTQSEDWQDRLLDAQQHHARSNYFTRRRIKRSHDGLWEMGAAIGHIAPGYQRRATYPATAREPERGPFYDEVDPQWSPIVVEAFQKIAAGDPPWSVAKWLTDCGLSKCANQQRPEWSVANVIALIRRPVYRGEQHFRKQVQKKLNRTGKSRPVDNDPGKVLKRAMPQLRIVSDEVWYAANAAIDARRSGTRRLKGRNHPLAGKPRDSRGPLSTIFVCGVCGAKMHAEGRNEGGYRCSAARRGTCWNKATALRQFTHGQIGQAIVQRLLSADGLLEAMCRHIEAEMRSEAPHQRRRDKLVAQLGDVEAKRNRLLEAIEAGANDLSTITARLRDREQELARLQAELDALNARDNVAVTLPTRQQLTEHIQACSAKLLDLHPEIASLLRRLLPTAIRAVPYRQFGSDKIVLRAEFDLNLVALLPDELYRLLQRGDEPTIGQRFQVEHVVVDLFAMQDIPRHAMRAADLRDAGQTYKAIGEALGVTLRKAELAVQLGKSMHAAGVSDAYTQVTEQPTHASRWRFTALERHQRAQRESDVA